MVVGRAPEVAPTAATVANLAGLQQNNVLQGRDLFREAFQHRYENDKRNDEYWTKHLDRTYGKTDAERKRWFNKKYAELPSPTRRAWERESQKRWARPWHTGQINALDVYANDDEIYYTRRDGMTPRGPKGKLERGRWSVSEQTIINEYNDDYQQLHPNFQSLFTKHARAINHARGEIYDAPAYPGSTNAWPSGPLPTPLEVVLYESDIDSIPASHSTPGSDWRYAGKCGQGSYGACMVYRQVDANERTLRTIVLKKGLDETDSEASDREREMLSIIRQNQHRSQYIVSFLGGRDSLGFLPGTTWLEYAPFGSLGGLIDKYCELEAVLPEPFLWYVFHCMAEAILFMESGVTDPTQPDDPAWVQADSPMIQTDMKPANILLDTPETTQSWFRIYPKPLLADFGGVLRLSNAHTIRGKGGTWGFNPFEMMRPMEQRIANDNRRKGPLRRAVPARGEPFAAPIAEVSAIGSAAAVYELGATMHNLLTLNAPQQLGDADNAQLAVPPYWSEQPRHMARRPWPWRGASRLAKKDWGEQLERGHARPFAPRILADGSLVEMAMPKELDGRGRSRDRWRMIDGESVWYPYEPVRAVKPAYSDRLIELAGKCMSMNIGDRPTPRQLMRETQAAMDDVTRQYPTPPLASTPASRQTPQALILPQNKFPVGEFVLNDFT